MEIWGVPGTTWESKGIQGRYFDDFGEDLEVVLGDDFKRFSEKVGPDGFLMVFFEGLFPRVVFRRPGMRN